MSAPWGDRRIMRIQSEADERGTDPRKQAELYKELMRSGNYRAVIQRFEEQPQLAGDHPAAKLRIQQDVECLRVYVDALARAGLQDKIAERVTAVLAPSIGPTAPLGQTSPAVSAAAAAAAARQSSAPQASMSADVGSNSGSGVFGQPIPPPIGEGRNHWVRTNLAEWERILGVRLPGAETSPAGPMPSVRPLTSSAVRLRARSNNGGGFGGFNNEQMNSPYGGQAGPGGPGQQQSVGPIQVVISEAWSWSKFVRELGSRIVYGVLLMTGLSVILDQQGIIKSGMTAAEVEPNTFNQPIKFADVQGVDEAKAELEEIVAFLREPKRFMDVGGKLPKGILLYGPPGTGKTHLARAVAGEAGVPFFQMSGSEFDELYVGVGARRVRELFAAAKKKAPCIVFIDEIDAVGSKRSAKDQSYMRQTLNQLLVELDGFSANEGVIFIAATNTPEALDKALVRPGRFDKHVPVPLPDVRGRAKILEVHSRDINIGKDVDMSIIARGTPGFSGADLANLVNQAAIKASKDGLKYVRLDDLEWAKDKIIMGSERKSAVITEQNRRLTAYHEGGHTLVALYTQGAMPLHKVTVIPRGNALGVTVQLPEQDKTNHTKRELAAMLDVCMGGRVAEELVFGTDEVTTGAGNDLEKATDVAREMVLRFGMSDKVGVVAFREQEMEKISTQTRAVIEAEVKALLEVRNVTFSCMVPEPC
ncbi:ATP-dependent zinc metalloprotease FTSH 4, mitochondrial [Quaeritorhiza haematococci]|nr:ATP-dependent zinc metalloprotease FTSH 4, mitochondrial [Quaeritorhiza haematococci]